jgi:TonB family protein
MFCSRCGTEAQVSTRFCPTCGLDLSTLTQGLTTAQPAPPAGQAPQPDEADIVRDALKDEYELEKELGRGGMAIVFKARDKSLEREVAIKVLPFSLSFDAEFVERFQREARTAGKLEHPNIIPIYRVGKSGRVIYFVMKYIRGKSLSAVVEARGALPVPELRRVLIECSRALGFAHKHGIVHRDIKPDNIMFDELGQAIVTDFGIAKAQSGARLTGTGMSIGTPHYMSPEQARAQNLDGRSDLYSLGVVAYQCLTGHVPFDGEDSFSIGYKHIMEELPTPPLEAADQRELFAIIQKMMAKKADDRFQTAEELVQALDTLGGESARVSVADLATMPTRAIPSVKPPAIQAAATAPLPRASASIMKKPDGAAMGAAAAPAAPAAPPKGKRPVAPPAKAKSKTPFYALGGVAVVLIGLGGYVAFGRGAPQPVGPLAPDSQQIASADTARRDSTAQRDSVARRDSTAAARADTPTTPVPGALTGPGRTRPGTRTTAPPTGPDGTISLEGNIPRGARITANGRSIGARQKLPPGQYTIRVRADGFRPYDTTVLIASTATTVHTVTLLPVQVATTSTPGTQPPGTATPQLTPGAPDARCAQPGFGITNGNSACYDVRPSTRTPPVLAASESCTGAVGTVTVTLRVSASGQVETASATRPSNCAAFTAQAVALANDLVFTPATKGGQRVAAWINWLVRPQ